MPQEFQVVRCVQCEAFQVQFLKKVPKWQCKICGQKQSVRKVYGQGTSKDCRVHVQKLNLLRDAESVIPFDECETELDSCIIEKDEIGGIALLPSQNKWSEFVEDKTDSEPEDAHSTNCVWERPRKRLKLQKDSSKEKNDNATNSHNLDFDLDTKDVVCTKENSSENNKKSFKDVLSLVQGKSKRFDCAVGHKSANTANELEEFTSMAEIGSEEGKTLPLKKSIFESSLNDDELDSMFHL